MILNYGPKGITSSSIDFGRTFNFSKDISFSYGNKTKVSFATAEEDNICSLIQNNKNWDLKILQDCTIEFLKKILIKNILLVGGGRDGEDGTYDANEGGQGYSNCYYTGGKGGDGGDILLLTEEKTFEKNLNVTCIIGNNQENTRNTSLQYSNQNFQTQLNNEKTYGKGEKGGIYQNGNYYAPAPISENYSKDGYLFHSEYYGAGGGGGGLQRFGVRDSIEKQGGEGGQTGGGNGEGYNNSNSASSGTNGYGAGGGGGIGSAYHYNHGIGSGAAGGSGVIIISNY